MAKRQFPTTVKIEIRHDLAETTVLDQDGEVMAFKKLVPKERLSRSVMKHKGNLEEKLLEDFGELFETLEDSLAPFNVLQALWDIETGGN